MSDHTHRAASASLATTPFAIAMEAGMQRMMRDMHRVGSTGNVDADFLAMMIPHHEGAVEMARLLLIHGRDPATRRLAEDIIAGQTTEIGAMRSRLAILRGEAALDEHAFPDLGEHAGPSRSSLPTDCQLPAPFLRSRRGDGAYRPRRSRLRTCQTGMLFSRARTTR